MTVALDTTNPAVQLTLSPVARLRNMWSLPYVEVNEFCRVAATKGGPLMVELEATHFRVTFRYKKVQLFDLTTEAFEVGLAFDLMGDCDTIAAMLDFGVEFEAEAADDYGLEGK